MKTLHFTSKYSFIRLDMSDDDIETLINYVKPIIINAKPVMNQDYGDFKIMTTKTVTVQLLFSRVEQCWKC